MFPETVLEPEPHEITADEGYKLIDERAWKYLGMSADEFIERYEQGELNPDDERVALVAMILPLGR